jgi:hypothetical protein
MPIETVMARTGYVADFSAPALGERRGAVTLGDVPTLIYRI